MAKLMGITRLPLAVVDEEGNSSCPWCGQSVSRKSSAHYLKNHTVRPALPGEWGDWVVVE